MSPEFQCVILISGSGIARARRLKDPVGHTARIVVPPIAKVDDARKVSKVTAILGGGHHYARMRGESGSVVKEQRRALQRFSYIGRWCI